MTSLAIVAALLLAAEPTAAQAPGSGYSNREGAAAHGAASTQAAPAAATPTVPQAAAKPSPAAAQASGAPAAYRAREGATGHLGKAPAEAAPAASAQQP